MLGRKEDQVYTCFSRIDFVSCHSLVLPQLKDLIVQSRRTYQQHQVTF